MGPTMSAMSCEQCSNVEEPNWLVEIAGNMPASYFGIVLGLAGLGNAWRAATQAWRFPAVVGELIYAAAGLVWASLVFLYLLKARFAPGKLAAEAAHPIQCCFIGLAGVSTMLIAGGLVPYWAAGARAFFALGAIFTLGFGVWRTGSLWRGERDSSTLTAVLYLPTVAGSFVSAIVLSALGHRDWGQIVFGAGLFSWLAMESVLMNRFLTGPSMPAALRPTFGIQLAPAPVGAVAYIAVGDGTPDVFAHALIGYGILQLLILIRLSRWFMQSGAALGLWAFSFGATAIAAAPLRLLAHGAGSAFAAIGGILFALANILIVGLVSMTVWLLAMGRMFTAPPADPPQGRSGSS